MSWFNSPFRMYFGDKAIGARSSGAESSVPTSNSISGGGLARLNTETEILDADHNVLTALPSGSDTSTQSSEPKDELSQQPRRPTDPMAGGEVEYKSMNWWQAGMLMIAETISLGILSLPSCVAKIGMAPGVATIIALGLLATYSGYVIGQFKVRYIKVVSMADAGQMLFGRVGRELFGTASTLMFICYMAAHILTFSICFNVLTDHATCTLVFGVIGLLVSILLSLPRTLRKVSYQSICSFLSIGIAVMITMIALGATRRGGENVKIMVQKTNFFAVVIGVMDIVMAYAGNVAFFSFISELTDPHEFPKALILLQTTTITIYSVVAGVIYYYGGSEIISPALGATSPVVRKVAYGVAIPTIIVAGVINAHIAAKYIYLRTCSRGIPPLFQQQTWQAWTSWVGIMTGVWVLAWVVASAVPNFNQLLALISALFGTWFTFGIPGMLWLYMNWAIVKHPLQLVRDVRDKWQKVVLALANVFLIILALVLCVVGMYASIKMIQTEEGGKIFSCDDNGL